MNEFRLSPMDIKDLDYVEEIEILSFSVPWSKEAYKREICENKFARYFTLKDEDRIVAYGGMWLILDEAHITNIAVHPDYRRKGLGKMLLKGMINFGLFNGIKRFTLEVKKSNEAAIRLYNDIGFAKAGVRKGYYFDTGEDAIIMWLNL